MPEETMNAVLEDWKSADIPGRTRAALSLLECMTQRPAEIDSELVARLKEAGLDELAIRETANVGFHFNWINRMVDAFDFTTPTGKQKAQQASMLNFVGKWLRGSYADPPWTRGDDGRIRATEIEAERQLLLSAKCMISSELRKRIEAYVAELRGRDCDETATVPDELASYLKKLALYAYRIMDEDFDALREAGYSDEEIYEITIVGSFGAAVVSIENLFAAMYGESVEPIASEELT